MLKNSLKKYKLLYKSVIEMSSFSNVGEKEYKLVENKKNAKIIIVNIDEFYKHIEDKKNTKNEFWIDPKEKYCNLRNVHDRYMMSSPTYCQTKVYCASQETLYDIAKPISTSFFGKNKEFVFKSILRSQQCQDIIRNLTYEAEQYIDEICANYTLK